MNDFPALVPIRELSTIQEVKDYQCTFNLVKRGANARKKIIFVSLQNGDKYITINCSHKGTCAEDYFGKNCDYMVLIVNQDPCRNK